MPLRSAETLRFYLIIIIIHVDRRSAYCKYHARMPRRADAAWMSHGCSADFAPITGLVDVGCLATASVTYLAWAVCVLCRPKISCAHCILGSQKQYKYKVHRLIRSLSFCALDSDTAAADVAGCGPFLRLQVGGIRT